MRRFAALTILAAALAAAAPAAADPFGELPFRPVPGVATCLRATGEPGGLARWASRGVAPLQATTGGLRPARHVRLGGTPPDCPVVAAQPGGAAVAAQVVPVRGGQAARVAVRDPGGAFGAPATVARLAAGLAVRVEAAVGPAGDALVALATAPPGRGRARLLAVRRAPGGRFGAVQRVFTTAPVALVPRLSGAVDAVGTATLAWADDEFSGPLRVATAPRGAPGWAVRRFGGTGEPALATAPGGRTLLAWTDGDEILAAERPPGVTAFGPVLVLARQADPDLSPQAAGAIRDDGAAVVAWREGSNGSGVRAVARAGPGRFGVPLRFAPTREANGQDVLVVGLAASAGPPLDEDGGHLRAAIGAHAFALSWTARDGHARGALERLDAPGAGVQRLGGALRTAVSTTPVALADGSTAVAWADDDGTAEFPTGGGRLHLAIAGAPPPAELGPPGIRVPHLRRQRRYRDDPLMLPVICAAACDVAAEGFVRSRKRAGRVVLRFFPRGRRPGPASVDVTVRAGAPNAHRTRTLQVRVPELIRRPPPIPAPLDVRARRRGADVVVSWRVAFAGRHVFFLVLGSRSRRGQPFTSTPVDGGRAGRFRARLGNAGRARYITVEADSSSGGRPHTVTVRVKR